MEHSLMVEPDELEGMAGRDVFGRVIVELGGEREEIVVLGADTMESARCHLFGERFPQRIFNFGIAEQNMVSAAAGFAIAGKIPVVAAYGFLLSLRCAEQVRSDLCYPNLNVKLVTSATGFSMGTGGPTHHCLEDVAVFRSFANMTVVAPASNKETVTALRACIVEHDGPVYVRLRRNPSPEIYDGDPPPFRIGRAVVLREGSDAALIASGEPVYLALRAARELVGEGIGVRVINMPTIKPLDGEAVRAAAVETGGIVTVEEHSLIGGLGEAVCSAVCETAPGCRVLRTGIPDTFCEIGPPADLWEHYGLNVENLKGAVRRVLQKQG